jgi:hypothetical protein
MEIEKLLKEKYRKSKVLLTIVENILLFPYTKNSIKAIAKAVGYDKAWSPISKNQTATYSSLPEGKYTFEVISCNNELKWNNESTSFSFTIDTPYWETWWFRTFGVLSFTGAISLIFYLRIRNIRKSGELW